MIINTPTVSELTGEQLQITFKLEECPLYVDELQYDIQGEFEYMLFDSLDCALVALLVPCMTAKEPIVLKGNISRRLFKSLPSIQKLLHSVYPDLFIIDITCDTLIEAYEEKSRSITATGFSGGVDSFAVIADLKLENFDYFLYNNVGSHGGAGESLFNKRYDALFPFSEEVNIPFIKVNSNLDDFYDDDLLNYIHNYSLRNISVALLLQRRINQYFFASAFHISQFKLRPRPDIARIDLMLLPLLSTENIAIFSHGTSMTRVEKTKLITTMPETFKYLDVCVDETDEKNCSNCAKCRRTMATLDILGKLGLYGNVFDLNLYYKNKPFIFFDLCLDKSTIAREVISFAKQVNFAIPTYSIFSSKVSAIAMPHLPYKIKKILLQRKPYKDH